MSKLAEKLHGLVTRMRGGADVATHDVEEVVTEITGHLNDSILPMIESKISDLLPTAIQKAISEALQAERAEAERIAARLEEVYKKFVEEYGHGAANAAMGGAVAPDEARTMSGVVADVAAVAGSAAAPAEGESVSATPDGTSTPAA